MLLIEPIMEFKDEQQAYECLRYWKRVLFLEDWTIHLELVDKCGDIDGRNCIGTTQHNFDGKNAHIEIERYTDLHKGHYCKLSQEHTLVHELLECKFARFKFAEMGITECEYYTDQHALLEQMAKSLIMAKYNLDFEWFKNF